MKSSTSKRSKTHTSGRTTSGVLHPLSGSAVYQKHQTCWSRSSQGPLRGLCVGAPDIPEEAEKAEFVKDQKGRAWVDFLMHIHDWYKGVQKMQPDSCQCYPLKGQEATVTNWNTKNVFFFPPNWIKLQREALVFPFLTILKTQMDGPKKSALFEPALSREIGQDEL